MDLIVKLFDVLFPVFFIIGIGYWYGKKDPKFDTKFITTFAGNFGLPAIIFYSFTTTNISIELFLRFSYYITLYVLIFSVIGLIILKLLNKDIYRLLPPLILPNTGNMGMPLCLFAYGKIGLAIATAATAMILIFHFSIGILLASKKFSLKPLLKCTPVYALIIFFNICLLRNSFSKIPRKCNFFNWIFCNFFSFNVFRCSTFTPKGFFLLRNINIFTY